MKPVFVTLSECPNECNKWNSTAPSPKGGRYPDFLSFMLGSRHRPHIFYPVFFLCHSRKVFTTASWTTPQWKFLPKKSECYS